jgi:palmitoyltransferase ZDHHC9/14/18
METGLGSASDGNFGGISPASSNDPTASTSLVDGTHGGRIRSMSNSSSFGQTSLGRKNSVGSTSSRQQSLRHPTAAPLTRPMSPSSTSKTHIGGIQPAPGFFRPHKPRVAQQQSTQTKSNSGEMLELGPLGGRRSQESADSFDGSHQKTTYGLSPLPTVNDASTRNHSQPAGRSLLPLLPIGSRSRKPTISSVTSSSPQKSDLRGSFDKIFRRTSSDNKRSSPNSRRNSSSFFGRRPPSPIDLEIGRVRTSQSSVRSSPTSLNTPTGINARQTDIPLNSVPAKTFETRRLSIAFSDNSNHHTDHSHAFIPHPVLTEPNALFPKTTTTVTGSKLKSKKVKKNHHNYPSKNIFLFGGRIITGGGDSPLPFIATAVLVLGLTGVWFGTTAVFWWRHSAGGIAITIIGAYLSLLTITNMFATVSVLVTER